MGTSPELCRSRIRGALTGEWTDIQRGRKWSSLARPGLLLSGGGLRYSPSVYILSMTALYILSTSCRFSFSVAVSSPPLTEKSLSRICVTLTSTHKHTGRTLSSAPVPLSPVSLRPVPLSAA